MDRLKKSVVAAVVALGLAQLGLAAANAAGDRSLIAMMDDDKMSMKSGQPSANSGMNMGQPGAQPQNAAGGDRMSGDKAMQMPAQAQECQGSACEQRSGMMQMMQMMDRMMRGQMNSSSGLPSGPNAASGPADVTERLEGRIAFLKAELQITDKQLADWDNLADALRASRQHLLEARKLLVMNDKEGSERLEHYERHLSERLEAIKSARTAFTRLSASLSETQKQTADAILLPLIATF